ncbi:MAG: pyridoxal phosphate-dependent aminotransferase family protein [Sphingobacteriaceae bacterium]|jgi:8-amino-7-oxononanoate synthase|nr:pyridoxal phosphate-dependent aminotransferase family protein [Sphingobacteriaceae bacterium]
MQTALNFINDRLAEREQLYLLRKLKTDTDLVDFCSNDYLGFARSEELKKRIEQSNENSGQPSGSTGSRLITGNTAFAEKLEDEIAQFHEAESGLLYNSGYDANLGLFSCLPQRGDTIITDELIHASIIDGARLSHANRFTFKHNDLESLRGKLTAAKGNIFIGVESIYSMDGDEAPLESIVALADEFGAAVIVDEAHATGIYGLQGRGLVNQYNLQNRVFARVVTFGKALGTHGAIVLGSKALRSYLINFSRSFIYTTAAPFHSLLSIRMAYQHLQSDNFAGKMDQTIAFFKNQIRDIAHHFTQCSSPIQSLIVGGNAETKALENKLKAAGYNVKAILSPTVPVGKERLRICLHNFNTQEEMADLVSFLKQVL